MKYKHCSISHDSRIIDVLKIIDLSGHPFVLITNNEDNVIGIMTDGDVRRMLINTKCLNTTIDGHFNTNFSYLKKDANFEEICMVFENETINYVPIVDNGKVINLISRNQFEHLILDDQKIVLGEQSFSEKGNNHKIVAKPWGFYKTTFLSNHSQSKIIFVFPGKCLSLQEHLQREEHWVVTSGTCEVIIGTSCKKGSAGMYFFIPKGCKHRLINPSDTHNLIITEVQIGSYFGEDDIVRYDDVYGRM